VKDLQSADVAPEQSIKLRALIQLPEFQATSTFLEQVRIACVHLGDPTSGRRFTWRDSGVSSGMNGLRQSVGSKKISRTSRATQGCPASSARRQVS
jgi:hypothetical protein